MGVDRADGHGLEAGQGGAVGDRGDPGASDLREVVNAIFYQNRTGCQWRYPPHDFPAWSAVSYYFGLWREFGLDQRIQELLRCCQVRERARRLEDPSPRDHRHPVRARGRGCPEDHDGTGPSIANMARRLTTPAPTWRDSLGLAA